MEMKDLAMAVPDKNTIKKYCAGSGRTALSSFCINTGNGIQITEIGGESPHIGAVAMALPRKSLKNTDAISSDCFVLPVPGHKDHLIAQMMAEDIASSADTVTVVSVGIHNDEINDDEIETIMGNAKKMTAAILHDIKLA